MMTWCQRGNPLYTPLCSPYQAQLDLGTVAGIAEARIALVSRLGQPRIATLTGGRIAAITARCPGRARQDWPSAHLDLATVDVFLTLSATNLYNFWHVGSNLCQVRVLSVQTLTP